MAPQPIPRRRSRDEVDSEKEDEESIDVESRSESRKRVRLASERSNSMLGTTPLNNHHDTNGLRTEDLRPQQSLREHQPGSIVRVKLVNFVTYEAVEFFPGPSLNMVIGPNGTGKSTLVCAICIGLGWSTNYLGRAKEVSEFVKHGTQEAMIEIELAKDGKRFKRNIVIRCVIKREGNRTIYSVNGENKSKKATVELARSLSIQIDNLCQFLPQDKVVEFAAMTPVELLKSTQRAVASQEMIDTHEELKGRKKEQASMHSQIEQDQGILSNLESRQRLQEADVERMREREEVIKKVEYLEAARPFAEYREARKVHLAARERKKELLQELNTLNAEVEPSLAALHAKKEYRNQINPALKERKSGVEKLGEMVDKVDKDYQALHEQATALDTEIAAEKRGGHKHKQDLARLNGNIDRLKRSMEDPPPDVDAAAYNEKIREKDRACDGYETEIRGHQDKQRELTQKGGEKNHRVEQAERDLEQLDSQAGKQNVKLERSSSDTYKAWQWIQENQGEFEKQVFGPPIVECSIKDPKYVDQIEALFQKGLMLSFTVQTQNDFKKLSNILHDRLRLSEVNIKSIHYGLDQYRPPMSEDEMRQVGFENWALKFVQAPDPVLAMLCAEIKLHETGVSLHDTTQQQFQMLERSNITSWVTSKSTYRVSRRREYGAGASSTQVRDVRRASAWTDQPVDLSAKHELEDNISGWKEELNSLKSEIRELSEHIKQARAKFEKAREERKLLVDEKSVKQKALSEFKGLPTRLAQEETKRDAAQDFLDNIRGRLDEINNKKEKIAIERAKIALTYVDAVETLRTAHTALHTAELMLIEAVSDVQVLTERNQSVTDLLKAKEAEVEDVTKEANSTRQTAEEIMKLCRQQLGSENEERNAFLRQLPEGQTVEELNNEIESEKARLELMHEGNGGVIREFERRQHQIEKLTSRVNELKTAKAELDGVVETLQGQWEPQLDALVSKISASFSYNMDQISCAGEVGIKKEDDFEQWAIQIRVKFRETEPLTPLDSHRQSGGERAVSTIFYLMSLQSLTRSPFRVVDEINQGMDPRNERLVHGRMVGIACGTSSSSASNSSHSNGHVNGDMGNEADSQDTMTSGSQYFLITPKLLHDLEYARGMRVLCIASGEFMPKERERVDFGACVGLMRELKGRREGDRGLRGMGEMVERGRGRVEVAAG